MQISHDDVCAIDGQCPASYVNLSGSCVLAAPVAKGSDPKTNIRWTCGPGGCAYHIPRASDPECSGSVCDAACPAPDFHVARMGVDARVRREAGPPMMMPASFYVRSGDEVIPTTATPGPWQGWPGAAADRAYIGSCTGGKLTDFRAAAAIMNGKTVRIDTFVVPATTEVARGLKTEKIGGKTLEEIFLAAGAKLGLDASCAACLGGPSDTFGRLNTPLSCISTTNRNFPGRMGHKEARVFLASPMTVAASSLKGEIADPRDCVI